MPSFFQRPERPQWPPPKKPEPDPVHPVQSPQPQQAQTPQPRPAPVRQETQPISDPAELARIESELREWFAEAPLDHPYIAALFEVCLARQQEENAPEEAP